MKNFLFIILLCLISYHSFSQKLSLDLYGGVTNYQGDLQDKRFTLSQSHLAGGLGLTYDLNQHFSIRSALIAGKVSASDKFTKNKVRNLDFTSGIAEFQLGLQYYIFVLEEKKFSPYIFASAAVFHFSPYTFDSTGAKYFLEPLSTEGQGFVSGKEKYKLTQIAIPFGGGVKYSFTDNVVVGIEFGLRKIFTDYLDDVSTVYVDKNLLLLNRGPKAVELASRGGEIDSKVAYPSAGSIRGSIKDDWYYFTGFTFSYRFPESGDGGTGFSGGRKKKSNFGCPPAL